MSTVAEIAEAIPTLSTEDLMEIERLLIQTYRDRKVGIIFDDAYGTVTEQDLRAIHEDALRIIDGDQPKP